jgi:hypothetical protein
LAVAASVEQPVVAKTIQQQSSATLCRSADEDSAVAASVEQPVVARMIQQQPFGAVALAAAKSAVEHPVVATRIQQQSFVVMLITPCWVVER